MRTPDGQSRELSIELVSERDCWDCQKHSAFQCLSPSDFDVNPHTVLHLILVSSCFIRFNEDGRGGAESTRESNLNLISHFCGHVHSNLKMKGLFVL